MIVAHTTGTPEAYFFIKKPKAWTRDAGQPAGSVKTQKPEDNRKPEDTQKSEKQKSLASKLLGQAFLVSRAWDDSLNSNRFSDLFYRSAAWRLKRAVSSHRE